MSDPGSFYVTGGSLRSDAPSYIERRADDELYGALLRGEFCYVLTPRQMGKSSLRIRTAARLRAAGVQVASLDLTAVGRNLQAEQWYYGLLGLLGEQLNLEDELETFWLGHERLGSLQRFMQALRLVVLPSLTPSPSQPLPQPLPESERGEFAARMGEGSILVPPLPPSAAREDRERGTGGEGLVIFIDEIDLVRSLPFSTDEFFAAIRECYNRRPEDPALDRLTFCLLGVASPTDLIRDTRMTPFNIGRRIELEDFSEADAGPLAQGLDLTSRPHPPTPSPNSGRREAIESPPSQRGTSVLGKGDGGLGLLTRILYWTGGHPYLTQRLCQAVAAQIDTRYPTPDTRDVDRVCSDLFLSHRARDRDDNLIFVRERLLRSEADRPALLELYRKVWSGQQVADNETDPLVSLLHLSGIARVVSGSLHVRNRIYARVFDQTWIRDRMPDAELRRQRAAYRRGLLRATTVATSIVLVMGVLVLIAVVSARRAEHNRLEANRRTAEAQQMAQLLKTALAAQGKALNDKVVALHDEKVQRNRAEQQTGLAKQKEQQARAAQQQAQQEQRRADTERAEAVRQKNLAQSSAVKSREQQERLTTANGTRLMDEGDLSGALLWFAKASSLDTSNLSRQAVNRMRIAAILRRMPRLVHLWFDVNSACFSPDGRRVVTGNLDGTARIWDAESGAPLARPMRHLMRPMPGGIGVVQARFSPDGRQVLTYGGYTAQVWDATTGEPLTRPLVHPQRVLDAEFSPDGRRIVTEVEGDTARIWDVGSGQVTAELEYPNHEVHHAEFSPDGHRVVLSINCAGRALIWDVVSGARHTTVWPDLSQIGYASFSPDGSRIVTAGSDGSARIFDTATGRLITPPLPHGAGVLYACFSPDGTRVATASRDNTARVWAAAKGASVTPPLQHGSPVIYVCFSPDGRRVATASEDMTTRIWDARTGEPLSPPLRHANMVETADFDAEGRRLLTVDDAGIARLWDVAGAELPDGFASEYSNVACAAFSPDGKRLATGDYDYTARIWDVETGRPLSPLLAHGGAVRDLAFSPDGKRLSTASDDGKARIWDTTNGKLLVTLPHPFKVSHLAFSADSRRVATTSRNSGFVWETATGRQVCALSGHDETITTVAFSPDGSRVVTAAGDTYERTVRVWDSATGNPLHCLPHPGLVKSACFSPDGRSILTACLYPVVHLWDASSGRLIRPLMPEGLVAFAAFSSDGRRIVTAGSSNNAARVWKAVTGEAIIPPLHHHSAVNFAAFSHDGRCVVTCSDDRTARVWDAATGEPITPPLHHDSFVRWAAFGPDGQRVLTLDGDSIARIWTLPQDRHSPAELKQLAQLLAAHRIDADGGLTALEPRELSAAWTKLPSTLREEYGPTEAQQQAWHIAEAAADVDAAERQQEASRHRQEHNAETSADVGAEAWARAIRHLDRLLEADSSNRWASSLRAYAHAQLGQWYRVLADKAQLSGSGGCLVVLASHRPVQKVSPRDKPLHIGWMLYHHALTCTADHTILVLLPAPGKRFTAVAGVAGMIDPAFFDSSANFSVGLGGREVFQSSGIPAAQLSAAVDVPLHGATAFVLRTRHTGSDLSFTWADARVQLMDGRTLFLSDLPIRSLGGL